MFAITVIVGAIVVAALDNYDGTTSVMASLACVANVGPGLGLVGPTDNFGLFSGSTKLFLSTLMILGRLEILAVAALFLPSFWRR
jgi:trk system potassium uptake protein TrkH